MSKTWVFVDLDMTLVDTKPLILSAGPEPKVYGSDEHYEWIHKVTAPEELAKAPAVPATKSLVTELIRAGVANVVFLTSRRIDSEDVTREWLTGQGFGQIPLIMRDKNDLRSSGELKTAWATKLADDTDTVLFIDDDPDGSLAKSCLAHPGFTIYKCTYHSVTGSV